MTDKDIIDKVLGPSPEQPKGAENVVHDLGPLGDAKDVPTPGNITPTLPVENIEITHKKCDTPAGGVAVEIMVPVIENPTKSHKKRAKRLAPRKRAMVVALAEELGLVTSACLKIKLDPSTHYDWLKTDTDYKEAVDALSLRKKDVIEKALLSLVIDKNPTAVIHASKSLLRDRGYGDVTELQHSCQSMQFNLITTSMQEIQDEKLKNKSKAGRDASSTG